MAFKEINVHQLKDSPFTLFSQDTCLITAQKEDKVNTMTIGWGGFGVVWGKDVVFAAVRSERYTYEFIEAAETFSITAFDGENKKVLGYCGSVSGRDQDKIKNCGLTLLKDGDTPYFEEARLVIKCRKLCRMPLSSESFGGECPLTDKWYKGEHGSSYHTMYVAEIEKILIKE